jgi:hypothetical protein
LREEGDVFVAADGAFGQFQPEDRLSLAVFAELKTMVAISWTVVSALVLYHGDSCNPDPPLFPDGVDYSHWPSQDVATPITATIALRD